MREASALSNREQILDASNAVMPGIYGPEPEHSWCYYFERADLARQLGHWDEVASLGNQALKLDDHPNNPVERFVFIEGYAHTGNWERALKEYVAPLLCRLWKRIETETTDGVDRAEAISESLNLFACNP
jgi:hypothetical protein